MQMLITSSMESLESAQDDITFQEDQRKRYEDMLTKIETVRDMSMKTVDREYLDHVTDLEKKYLKEAEWILEPLENPKNNFFDPLIREYVKDLEIRNNFEMR